MFLHELTKIGKAAVLYLATNHGRLYYKILTNNRQFTLQYRNCKTSCHFLIKKTREVEVRSKLAVSLVPQKIQTKQSAGMNFKILQHGSKHPHLFVSDLCYLSFLNRSAPKFF